MEFLDKSAKNTAKYLVYKSYFVGEPITNLKLQKLLYYCYVWHLVLNNKRAFQEKFQAWPIGPVLPSIYRDLKNKRYGAKPIDPNYSLLSKEGDLTKLQSEIGSNLVNIIDKVFRAYGSLTAFELVNLTHSEDPWKNARKGLAVGDKTSNEIKDEDIKSFYGEKTK